MFRQSGNGPTSPVCFPYFGNTIPCSYVLVLQIMCCKPGTVPCAFSCLVSHPQDIFECRTCGLTGSLCCCTECAYSCHRGHDCSFKRASPTAYCDCWEGSKCRSLALGGNYERKSLLLRLLNSTSLGTRVNGKKEHLLGMLATIFVRQQKEQSNYTGLRPVSTYR